MPKVYQISPKKVITEFNNRALKRRGLVKVLSDRFGLELNEEFNDTCNNFIKKYFPQKLKNVADIGIGMGRLARYFSEKCDRLIGIDFSDKMLVMANKYLGEKENVALIYNDAVEIDFLPNYFDLGIVSLVLKHNDDQRTIKIIKKLKKWCKKILLIEHIAGGAPGSNISVMRTGRWYISQFKPMKPTITHKFKRGADHILLCIFE